MSTTPLPPDLENKLTEFLQVAPPLRDVMAKIVEWQTRHDDEHRKMQKNLGEELESHHFRLRSLEAVAGRGWWGIARLAALVAVAASGGYALRAAIGPGSAVQAGR